MNYNDIDWRWIKPLGYYKKNLKNFSMGGGLYTPNESFKDYIKRRFKDTEELTLEELEKLPE